MRHYSLRLIAIICGTVIVAQVAQGAPAVGSICVAPLPQQAQQLDAEYPGGKAPREYTYHFSIQVDERRPVAVARDVAHVISDLQLGKSHRVIIRDGQRVIESFRFTFRSRGGNSLCLSYGPWYQTWSLEKPGRQPWCKCR